ncbi:uracil-DNA glycosylase [Enterococcus hermanniensis]|uniref:Uracil-DNA glycosylase, family 4 n=1 Tax=Enterococcus hermanniensis TaxID=249189 RepID=A0A1L8TRJ9_9ENTE|nr:uracil-DNA glycosylase [Enterococcus hermanniensis]OJG46945.1 uracil-DNA glycosylase, family 4 [Enterococcus hermanniensis]
MDYPETLIELVAQRSKGFQLEGFIAGQGPLQPKLMLIGEAPGRNEVINHIPFSGAAGKELLKVMAEIGLTRENTYITSAVRSRPYKIVERINKRTKAVETVYPNRTPTKKEILAHAPILDYELATVQPPLIATLGNIGLQRLLGPKQQISDCHGDLYQGPIFELTPKKEAYQLTNKIYTVFPLFHPAAIFYNRSLSEKIQEDWTNLGKLLEKEVE